MQANHLSGRSKIGFDRMGRGYLVSSDEQTADYSKFYWMKNLHLSSLSPNGFFRGDPVELRNVFKNRLLQRNSSFMKG
jgi:hypothetical protein